MKDWLLLLIGALLIVIGILVGFMIGTQISKLGKQKQAKPGTIPGSGAQSEVNEWPNLELEPNFTTSCNTLVTPAHAYEISPKGNAHFEQLKKRSFDSTLNSRNRCSILSFYTAEAEFEGSNYHPERIDEPMETHKVNDLSVEHDQVEYLKREMEPIDEIKIRLKGIYDPSEHSDYFLHRFLRARKYDVDKTEIMLRNFFEWREKANVEQIVNEFAFTEAKEVFEYYPQFYHKTDKQGRTIYIEQMKNLDYKKLMSITTTERMLTRHIREYEKFTRYRLKACSIKQGKNIENGFTIIDLKGVPLSQFNEIRKTLQLLSTITSDYYPETLGTMFVINAPLLFTAIWKIVKQMLDERTVDKINILGSNFKSQLMEFVEKENLPAFYGGTCSCPGGCENSDLGPWNDGTVEGFPQEVWEFKSKDHLI